MISARARAAIREAMGVTVTHRIRWLNADLADNAVSPFGLLTADDEPDYDVDGTNTTICECEVGSRIVGMDLQLILTAAQATDIIEWMIVKDPDQALGTSVSPAALFTMDRTTTTMLLRKYVLAYGIFKATSSKETAQQKVRITRQALRRAGVMLDLDRLRLHALMTTGGVVDGKISVVGRIWTRK